MHTHRVLESLRRVQAGPIYFFSDGPQDPKDVKLVDQTRALFNEIDWTTARQVFSTQHRGLRQSIIRATDAILGSHPTVIVLEDDCVVGPFFIDFMEECFARYRDVEAVMSISGYSIPISSRIRGLVWDAYFFPRISSWGWGTWKHKWTHFRRDLGSAVTEAWKNQVDLKQGGNDVPALIEAQRKGTIDSWAINWIISVYLEGGCCVYPMDSHIENIGFDGTGTHCVSSNRFDVELARHKPTNFPGRVFFNEAIVKYFRGFYS